MGKPSIFSKDYQRKMRRRKIKIAISLILIVIVVSATWFLKGGKVQKWISNLSSKKESNIENDNKKDIDNIEKKQEKELAQKKEQPKGYEVDLSNGQKIKVMYEKEDNENKFEYIEPVDSKVHYSINSSKNYAAIFDDKTQNIIGIDIDGKIQDITNKQYVSSSGFVINKEEQLKSNPDYIWCSSPKFIDDDNIAYISQLPWLNKETRFVWILNVKDGSHTYIQGIEGNEIEFDKVTEKGLTVIVDEGTPLFLKGNGEITE